MLVIVFCFWLCVLCGTLKKKKKATATKKKGRGKVFSILFFCVCRVKNRPERDKNEEYYRGHTTYVRTGTTKLGLLCGTHLWY